MVNSVLSNKLLLTKKANITNLKQSRRLDASLHATRALYLFGFKVRA